MNPVGSRTVASEMGFDNPLDIDSAGKREEFALKLATRKRGWEMNHSSFVTDRTPIDDLVYSAFLGDARTIDEPMLQLAIEGLARYTHVVVLPFDGFHSLGDDPTRVQDTAFQKLYELTLQALLDAYLPKDTAITHLWTDVFTARTASVERFLKHWS